MYSFARILLLVVVAISLAHCSKKKKPDVNIHNMEDKLVALAEIKGPKEARKLTEVALVNEIIEKGRFQIVDRATVAQEQTVYPTEIDWPRLGKKLGADYILSIHIIEYDVKKREGFDKVEEEDSVLAEEHHEKKMIGTRYQKVKGTTAKVRLRFKFFDVKKSEYVFNDEITRERETNSRDPHSPRQMQLLEQLMNEAIRTFFEKAT